MALCALVPSLARGNAIDHLRTTDDIGENKIPHVGTSHVLVIPMRVGETAFPAARLAELRRFYDPAGGVGTFRHHWQVVSQGQWDPIPTLVEPVLYDQCPIPGRTVDTCTVSIMDIALVSTRAVQATFVDLLTRVRDEQRIDLQRFDVNGATTGVPDGFLDGVIVDTDIYRGIALPIAAFDNGATLPGAPGGGGALVTAGIVALVPPDLHEFGHALGFMDLYRGPPVNCLMADLHATLSAFSRQQIGWGEVRRIRGAKSLALAPVLDGGPVLRLGDGPQYLLVENRAGQHHAAYESAPPGVYVYGIDEDKLPFGSFGFLDFEAQDLYLPNSQAPYLDVNLPVGCSLLDARADNACVVAGPGAVRELRDQAGAPTGYTLRLGAAEADGTVQVTFEGPPLPPDAAAPAPDAAMSGAGGGGAGGSPAVAPPVSQAGGCATGGGDAIPALLLGAVLLFRRRTPPFVTG